MRLLVAELPHGSRRQMRQNEINHRALGFFGPFYNNEVKNGNITTELLLFSF